MTRKLFLFVPLLLLAALILFLAIGMQRDRGENGDFVPSRMIGEQMPAFDLPQAVADRPALDTGALADGQPKYVNLFASWCLPCAAEAAQLEALTEAGITIHGVAIRDDEEALSRFFDRYGNPYRRIGRDDSGQLQLALGASGIPETYLIGPDGTVLYQHIGDVREDDVPDLIRRYREAAR